MMSPELEDNQQDSEVQSLKSFSLCFLFCTSMKGFLSKHTIFKLDLLMLQDWKICCVFVCVHVRAIFSLEILRWGIHGKNKLFCFGFILQHHLLNFWTAPSTSSIVTVVVDS